MKNTEKSAAQWQEIVSEKDKEIAQLRKQVDWFKGQFKLLQSKQFDRAAGRWQESHTKKLCVGLPDLWGQ